MLYEVSILIGRRQHILDGGVIPSEGGTVAYFWKAAFLDGGSIPSRAGMIRLSGGKHLRRETECSVGGVIHQFATTYLQRAARCLRKAARRHIFKSAIFFGHS